MPTIADYIKDIRPESIYDRLCELQRSQASFSRIYRIVESAEPPKIWDDHRSPKQLERTLETPYRRDYVDGVEVWLGWPFAGSGHLKAGTAAIGVFGLYFPEKKVPELWKYYVGNIIPTADDL